MFGIPETPRSPRSEADVLYDSDEEYASYSSFELKIVRVTMYRTLLKSITFLFESDNFDRPVLLSSINLIRKQLGQLRSAHIRYVMALDRFHEDARSASLFHKEIEQVANRFNERAEELLNSLPNDPPIDQQPAVRLGSVLNRGSRSGSVMSRGPQRSHADYDIEPSGSFLTISEAPSSRPASVASADDVNSSVSNLDSHRKPKIDWIDEGDSPPIFGGHPSSLLTNMLPKFKIEPFNGNPKDWPNFSSSFRDMVHNVVPSNAQRLAILKQLLTSDVRMYIAEWLDRPEHYFDALRELKKRYGNPQVVARAHLRTLMSLPSVKEDDFNELSKLSRALQGAMHALVNGGYDQDLESGISLEHVVSKLPQRLRTKWGIKIYKMTPRRATLKDLAMWLDEFVMGDMMTRMTHGPSKPKSRDSKSSKSYVLSTESDSSFASERGKCPYCSHKHPIIKCFKFKKLDVKARSEWVKEKNFCFRCLNGTHRSAECEIKQNCTVEGCTRRHHFLLHGAPRLFPPPSAPPVAPPTSDSVPKPPIQTVNASVNHVSSSTLLTFVPSIVYGNGKSYRTNAS